MSGLPQNQRQYWQEKMWYELDWRPPIHDIDVDRMSKRDTVSSFSQLGESSFNMTRGGRGWRYWGGIPKIFYTPEGGLWKNCWARRGALKFLLPKKGEGLVRGAAKMSSFEFQNLHSPPCHIKWTFPTEQQCESGPKQMPAWFLRSTWTRGYKNNFWLVHVSGKPTI